MPARSIGAGEYSHYSGMNNAHSNRNLAVCLTTIQPNCASHPISCPIVLPDTDRVLDKETARTFRQFKMLESQPWLFDPIFRNPCGNSIICGDYHIQDDTAREQRG